MKIGSKEIIRFPSYSLLLKRLNIIQEKKLIINYNLDIENSLEIVCFKKVLNKFYTDNVA